ncbi:MAG: metallophosphoesterase [Clostridia bacterium]|nr:metallophosphoesterase [Clostridia bacterium]
MSSNIWRYRTPDEDGFVIRDVTVSTEKGGEDVVIVQITDPHFNLCNENDLRNEVLASTYANRRWNAEGESAPRVAHCLDCADREGAQQVVITGDALDYLSEGGFGLLKEIVWDRYGAERVMVTLGNHESTRHMQASPDITDPTTLESRMEILQENWLHDIYYHSKVLGDKVLLIALDNGAAECFWDCQIEPLRRDLTAAREHHWKVLLFYHIPLATANPAEKRVEASMVGDPNGSVCNFCEWGIQHSSEGASGIIYDMIVQNGDVIAGCFCGHNHNDFYTEILAKTAQGEDTVIPQYVLIGTPYGKGHCLKITVR